MRSPTTLEVRFAQARLQLNERRQRLIRAILDNPEETFYLSSRELARRYQVDAATVVRTVQALGYEKFADFTADLRRHFVTRITPYTVMRASTREKRSLSDHVRHCVEIEMQSVNGLRSSLDIARVTDLARQIHRAQRVLVVGVDLAASLAWFLAYGLTPLGYHAEAPTGSAGNLQHRIRVLTRKDLLVAISFGRCLRETIECVLRAKAQGVPTFGITDSDTTPIAVHCDKHVLAPVTSLSITGSYVVPMALLNAVLVACAHLEPKRSLTLLRQTEEEYTSGSRWYQEPPRRPRSANGSAGKSPGKRKRRNQARKTF